MVYLADKNINKDREKQFTIDDSLKEKTVLDSSCKLTYPDSRRPGIPSWIALSHYLPNHKPALTAAMPGAGGEAPTTRDVFSVNCALGPVT